MEHLAFISEEPGPFGSNALISTDSLWCPGSIPTIWPLPSGWEEKTLVLKSEPEEVLASLKTDGLDGSSVISAFYCVFFWEAVCCFCFMRSMFD